MDLRRTLKYLFATCGIALFIRLIYSIGPEKVMNSIQQMSWGIVAILATGGSTFVVRTLAWRITLGREHRALPLGSLLRIYLVAESLGVLFWGGLAVADTARVLLLGGSVPTMRAISASILDSGLYIVASAILLASTMILLSFVLHRGTVPAYVYVIGVLYSAIMAAVWIGMRKRLRLLSRSFSLALRLRRFRSWAECRRTEAAQVEKEMFQFLDADRPGLWSAFSLNIAAQILAAFEVLLVLWLLSTSRSTLVALSIEGLTKIANMAGIVIPGNVGTYEAGNMTILKMLGFPAAIGLLLALVRDSRRLFWVGVGLFLYFVSGTGSSRAELKRASKMS